MGTAMASAISGVIPGCNMAVLTPMCIAQAQAIIDEFTANALVPAATIIAPAGGGPCTGAGAIT